MQATPFTSSHQTGLKIILLILLTVIAYAPSLSNGFIWDDDGYVQANPTLRSVEGLVDIWTKRGATPQYYPLVHTTFWGEYQLWGLWAPGYHATNLLLHITASLLWWVLLTRLGLKRIAYLCALVFALHPIHVETVCWITERKNVLSLVCYLLAALCYLRFAEKKGWYWYALALLSFIGALLSKTVTCTFPAAMILVLWVSSCASTDSIKTVMQKIPWKQAFLLIPFFVIGITLARITISMESNEVGASGDAWSQTLPERIIIYSRVVLFYFHKVLYPDVFMFNYPRWTIDGQNLVLYSFPLALLTLVVSLWWQRKRITLWPLAGLLFAIGTLLPASGLFNVYPMRFSFVADHFAYHATMGLIAIGVGLFTSIAGYTKPLIRRVFWCLMLLILMTQTMRYTPAYADWFTLFTDTLQKNPDSWMAYNYRGVAYEKLYDQTHNPEYLTRAHDDYRHGLQRHQQFAQLYANDGSSLIKLGDPANAITQLKRAVQLQPDLPQGHYWLGLALEQTGQYEKAFLHHLQAVGLFPGYVSAWHHLARTYQNLGNTQQAAHAYQQAIALRPQSPGAYQELGLLYLKEKQYAEAQRCFAMVLKLAPQEPAAMWPLGLSLYMQGDTTSALSLLKQAASMSPDNALKLDLAWVLATCPESQLRDAALAEACIKDLPDSPEKQAIHQALATPPTDGQRSLIHITFTH